MKRQLRSALILAAIYVLIAAVLMIREEWVMLKEFRHIKMSHDWYERHMENLPPQKPINSQVGWDCRLSDYFPSFRVKLIYLLNFPTALLLGWYRHPVDSCTPPLIMRAGQKLQIEVHGWYRIVLFDSVLLLAIGVHWFLLGYIFLRLRVPISAVKFFTGFAILLACLAFR